MSNQKKHLEEVSQKYPVKNKQKKVVENNVTENRFSAIKRSVKKPKDIDEKIEYLEKEYQKTGLNEITMSTRGLYSVQGEEENPAYATFNNASCNGKGFAMTSMSGLSIGGAYTSAAGYSYAPDGTGPAVSYRGISNGMAPSIPGSQQPGKRRIGAFMWYWNGSSWSQLEWKFNNQDVDNSGQWARWKPGAYNPFLDPILGDASFDAACLAAVLAAGGGSATFPDPDSVTPPTHPVLFQNDLGDSRFIPIDTMSSEAYRYLSGQATASSGVNYDVYNRLWDDYGIEAANWYENNPNLPGSSNPHIPAGATLPLELAMFGLFGGGRKPIKPVYGGPRGALGREVQEFDRMSPLGGGPGGVFKLSHVPEGDLLSEAVKLGYFDPEVLNVDIEDIRKGIVPEFPKDEPEMIGGYSAKSRLVRKDPELPPFIKVTRKDLAKHHLLTDKEITQYMKQINAINEYIKKNPAELIYAMTRYPKNDPRLAQLNFKLDQMKKASDRYIDKQFPENQKLFDKLQDKIKQNIELTDPKNFIDHKRVPTFVDTMKEQKKMREKKKNRKWIKAMSRNK